MPRREHEPSSDDLLKELLDLQIKTAKQQSETEDVQDPSDTFPKREPDPLRSIGLWYDGLWQMGMDLD
jgi:hypothetical protein